MEQTVAIITARGGSKRIPRKNIKEFCKKPIIEYSIEAAIQSDIFDEVMVSTEDDEIAGLAKRKGAKVPFLRSAENADDYSTTVDVLTEVLKEYQKAGKHFSAACCIYPTAPFVTAEKLKRGWELLRQTSANVVVPVVAYSFPPQRGVVMDQDGFVRMQYPEYELARSQDLETIYHDCGQFYFFKVPEFLKSGKLWGEKAYPLVMRDSEVQDIDNEEDWRLAELKYALMVGKGHWDGEII